jgi:hypothetical protein
MREVALALGQDGTKHQALIAHMANSVSAIVRGRELSLWDQYQIPFFLPFGRLLADAQAEGIP